MSAPATWAEFVWPDWVPVDLRQLVEDFWSHKNGRGPRQWVENAVAPYNGGAPLGTRGAFWRLGFVRRIVVGRYVHAWNNIGRVVLDDGSVECVSGVVTVEAARKHVERVQVEIDSAYALAKRLENERAELNRYLLMAVTS